MFIGNYANTMDNKGRVNIPATFRDALHKDYDDERMVIARDIRDACLRLYPMQEWQFFLDKLNLIPASNPTLRRIQRRVVSSAIECTADRQGRVLLPQSLREHASLSKCVQFAGLSNTVEIWDTLLWQHEIENDAIDSNMLEQLGI
ncbi:MAG: division/cell wall cluster transcriptional repressor MraZ [Mariprofundaceae bacterium]|nr:division/cell wall cluster transcriptional repressor MraZ [Mariprofundaceae bacterium]